jgi:hypothetical protein
MFSDIMSVNLNLEMMKAICRFSIFIQSVKIWVCFGINSIGQHNLTMRGCIA